MKDDKITQSFVSYSIHYIFALHFFETHLRDVRNCRHSREAI